MGPFLVVVFDPAIDGPSGSHEAPEVVLPHAFLFQTAEEALYHSVQLRRMGRMNSWESRWSRRAALNRRLSEDETVVASHDRDLALGAKCAEAVKAGLLRKPVLPLWLDPEDQTHIPRSCGHDSR